MFVQNIFRRVEETVLKEFTNIDQIEIAMVYSALDFLSSKEDGSPSQLKNKIQDTYGFRL